MTPTTLTTSAISVPFTATDSAFREAWNAALARSRFDHLHQSYEWAVLKQQFGWEVEFLAVPQQGEPAVGALVLAKPLAGGLLRVATVSGGPFWLPGEEGRLPELFALLVDHCRRKRIVLCRIHMACPVEDFEPLATYLPPSCVHLPHVWTYWNPPRPIMVLDIRGTIEETLARMHHKTRYRHRTALRRGVSVVEDRSAGVEEFSRLMREMARKKKIPVREPGYFKAVLEAFGPGRSALLMARHEGRVLGGQLVVRAGRRAYALYAAVEHAGNLNPSEALDVATIEWAKEKGCEALDLGGTCTNWPPSPEDKGYGVYDYKRRLGAATILLAPYLDLTAQPVLYRTARLAEDILLPLVVETGWGRFQVIYERLRAGNKVRGRSAEV
jgi:lipid II:glycine glycyltransferase (peptidoglycan interpeptide bridge formation enzyme)